MSIDTKSRPAAVRDPRVAARRRLETIAGERETLLGEIAALDGKRREAIAAGFDAGMTAAAIADALGFKTRKSVYDAIRGRG